MKYKTWTIVAAFAALSACSTPGSQLVGTWVLPFPGERTFEFKADGTMTELSKLGGMFYSVKGSGTWEATEDTLTWTETTVEVLHDTLPPEHPSFAALTELWKAPKTWLYTMRDQNKMRLVGADGTVLELVRTAP